MKAKNERKKSINVDEPRPGEDLVHVQTLQLGWAHRNRQQQANSSYFLGCTTGSEVWTHVYCKIEPEVTGPPISTLPFTEIRNGTLEVYAAPPKAPYVVIIGQPDQEFTGHGQFAAVCFLGAL